MLAAIALLPSFSNLPHTKILKIVASIILYCFYLPLTAYNCLWACFARVLCLLSPCNFFTIYSSKHRGCFIIFFILGFSSEFLHSTSPYHNNTPFGIYSAVIG